MTRRKQQVLWTLLIAVLFVFSLGLSGASSEEVYLNFSNYPDGPAKTSGITSWSSSGTDRNPHYENSLRLLYPDSKLTAKFHLKSKPQKAELMVEHLSSKSGMCPNNGYSPVTISINGKVVVSTYDVAKHHGGSHGYETDWWKVADKLRKGSNTIKWEAENLCTHYWLKRFEIQLSYTRGGGAWKVPYSVVATPKAATEKDAYFVISITTNRSLWKDFRAVNPVTITTGEKVFVKRMFPLQQKNLYRDMAGDIAIAAADEVAPVPIGLGIDIAQNFHQWYQQHSNSYVNKVQIHPKSSGRSVKYLVWLRSYSSIQHWGTMKGDLSIHYTYKRSDDPTPTLQTWSNPLWPFFTDNY